ncbi:hypothetical protein BC792_1282 [Sphingobacterium allocomposti]|uniref:Uncharacterized protein n=1 Tax=Sphingobacterium allocomposti TaxID=415956 RepID=A0A5S5CZU1_9SPHI|nr:hypothetical protein BC792_1282 [Sphingobacterium composti Yoo et al. 2007 non Ten et al. 2007]
MVTSVLAGSAGEVYSYHLLRQKFARLAVQALVVN